MTERIFCRRYRGQEDALFKALRAKYITKGKESCHSEKLQKFYAVHNPSKLNSIPQLLVKHQGREDELMVALNDKYTATFIEKYEVTKN